MNFTYYVFFPVRDGEETIEQVMNSLINQTIKPEKILVVDDGSTDKTTEILDRFQKKYPELVSILRTESKTRDFRRIPKLWNMCLQKEYDFHMIGAGDCIFEKTYAEKILQNFSKEPNLVICSGDFRNGKSRVPHGAGRFIKQEFFFSNYKEYPDIIGYESEIIARGKLKNYSVKIFNDIVFEHVDKLGHSHNFSEFGQGMRALGYHPLYVFGRFGLEFFGTGEIGAKGALNMIWKYITYRPEKTGYYSQFPKEFRKEMKKYQWEMIKKFLIKKIKLH
jgi:glycosyltransferase involved in cell wall biosynthesis